MSLGGWTGVIALGVWTLAACGGAADEGETAEGDALDPGASAEAVRQARADSMAMAEEAYDPAAFDSIDWRGERERLERGQDVWNFSCGDCHGWQGRGDGPVATRHEYDVPDFTAVGWEAGGLDSLRHRVFVGHETEMPSWGLYGLTYRDIDAVTFYIDETFGE